MIVAVDPGKHQSSLAYGSPEGDLIALAWFVHNDEFPALAGPTEHFENVTRVECEYPFIYPRTKARPNDQMDLMWSASEVAHWYGCPIRKWYPRTWKGQIPKPIHHGRLWRILTPAERALFPADTEAQIARGKRAGEYNFKFPTHNQLDAAALLLTATGRMRK